MFGRGSSKGEKPATRSGRPARPWETPNRVGTPVTSTDAHRRGAQSRPAKGRKPGTTT
jgi:hypothetical protein